MLECKVNLTVSWDRWDNLDLGLSGAHGACQGQPGMSPVVLGQMGHLGPGTWWCHTLYQGQPGMSLMSRVVVGTTLAFDGNPR